MESSDNLYGMNVKEAKCYNMGIAACISELRAALYPNGIKHPQLGEWKWMIQDATILRARIAQLEAPPSEGEILRIAAEVMSLKCGRHCFIDKVEQENYYDNAKAAIETFMEGRR